jgi:hypothetical protein
VCIAFYVNRRFGEFIVDWFSVLLFVVVWFRMPKQDLEDLICSEETAQFRIKKALSYVHDMNEVRNKQVLYLNRSSTWSTSNTRMVVRSLDLMLQTMHNLLCPAPMMEDSDYPEVLRAMDRNNDEYYYCSDDEEEEGREEGGEASQVYGELAAITKKWRQDPRAVMKRHSTFKLTETVLAADHNYGAPRGVLNVELGRTVSKAVTKFLSRAQKRRSLAEAAAAAAAAAAGAAGLSPGFPGFPGSPGSPSSSAAAGQGQRGLGMGVDELLAYNSGPESGGRGRDRDSRPPTGTGTGTGTGSRQASPSRSTSHRASAPAVVLHTPGSHTPGSATAAATTTAGGGSGGGGGAKGVSQGGRKGSHFFPDNDDNVSDVASATNNAAATGAASDLSQQQQQQQQRRSVYNVNAVLPTIVAASDSVVSIEGVAAEEEEDPAGPAGHARTRDPQDDASQVAEKYYNFGTEQQQGRSVRGEGAGASDMESVGFEQHEQVVPLYSASMNAPSSKNGRKESVSFRIDGAGDSGSESGKCQLLNFIRTVPL